MIVISFDFHVTDITPKICVSVVTLSPSQVQFVPSPSNAPAVSLTSKVIVALECGATYVDVST